MLVPGSRAITYGPPSFAVSEHWVWSDLPPTLRTSSGRFRQFHSRLKICGTWLVYFHPYFDLKIFACREAGQSLYVYYTSRQKDSFEMSTVRLAIWRNSLMRRWRMAVEWEVGRPEASWKYVLHTKSDHAISVIRRRQHIRNDSSVAMQGTVSASYSILDRTQYESWLQCPSLTNDRFCRDTGLPFRDFLTFLLISYDR